MPDTDYAKIVVIDGEGDISDRSWACPHALEAIRLQRWLKDNHILSRRMTVEEFNVAQSKASDS